MDRLVKELSIGRHRIEFEPRTKTIDELKKRIIEMKFVFVRFTDTQGETELGVEVDEALTDISQCDFATGHGLLKLVGACELNYYKVICHAEVDLATRFGQGYLEIVN